MTSKAVSQDEIWILTVDIAEDRLVIEEAPIDDHTATYGLRGKRDSGPAVRSYFDYGEEDDPESLRGKKEQLTNDLLNAVKNDDPDGLQTALSELADVLRSAWALRAQEALFTGSFLTAYAKELQEHTDDLSSVSDNVKKGLSFIESRFTGILPAASLTLRLSSTQTKVEQVLDRPETSSVVQSALQKFNTTLHSYLDGEHAQRVAEQYETINEVWNQIEQRLEPLSSEVQETVLGIQKEVDKYKDEAEAIRNHDSRYLILSENQQGSSTPSQEENEAGARRIDEGPPEHSAGIPDPSSTPQSGNSLPYTVYLITPSQYRKHIDAELTVEDKLPGYDLGSNHVAVELGTGRTPLEEEVELTTSTERIPGGKAVVVQLAVGDTFQYQEIGRPDIPSRVKVHGRFVDKQQVGWFYHLEDLYEEDDIGVHGDEVRITQVVDDDGYREVDVHVDENGYFTLEARPGTINITYEYNDETRTSEHDTDHYAAIVQIDTEGESPEPSPEPEPEPEPGPGPDEELQPTSLQIRSFVVQEDVPVPEADQADLLIRGKRPSEDQWRTLDRASQVERYSYDIDQPEEFRDVLLSIQATYAGDKDVEEETKSFVIKDLNYHLSTGEPINKVISFTESTRSPSPEGGEPKPIEIHVTSRLYESETGKPVGLIETDIFLEVHEDDKWVTAEQQSTTDGRTTFKIDPNRYHGEHVRVRGTHERDQDVQEQTQPLTDLDAYMERGEPLEKELRFDRDDDHDEETDTAEVHGRLVQAERVSKAVSQEEANELLEAKKEGAVGKGLAGTVTLLSHDGENAKRLDTTESDGNGFFAFNVPMEQVQGKHLAVAGVPKHTKQKRSSFARHYNGGYPQDWFQVSEDQPEQSVIIPVQQRPLQIGLSPSYTNILANKELNTGPIGELQSTEEQEKQITFNVQANRPGIGVPKLYFLSTDEVQEVPEEAITISAEKQAPEQKNGAYRFKGETKQTIKVDLEFAEEPPCLKRLYCVIYRDEETASSTMFDDLLPTLLNQEYNNQNGDTALPLWTRLYSTASEVDLDSYLHDFDFVDVKLVGSEYVSRRKKRTENRIKQKVLQPIGEAGMQSESNWTSEQFADHDYVIAFTNDFEWKAEVVQEKIENILEIAHEVEHVFYEHLGQVARYYEDYDDFKTDLETLHSVQKAEDLDQRRTLLQQRQGDVPQTGQELMQRVYQTFYEVFNTETGIALKEEES